ncbi:MULTISPECIES: hypothetical protein [unclassified Carboxylicivirga]|uniref:hypothetical protein n=1 Tax=Carboxylicivirga TaxID=1628153 RepID=UPI003D340490
MSEVRFFKALSYVLWFILFSGVHVIAQEPTKIIASGDAWMYYDGELPPPSGWEKGGVATEGWKQGNTCIGYGDKVVNTVISYGNNPGKKHMAAYFCKSFMLDDPYAYLFYQVNIIKDDGIVLYLNGREIYRNNMPEGKVTHHTRAASLIVNNPMEAYRHQVVLAPADLNAGLNTLAASVHQGKKTSEDLIFNLELIGDNNAAMLPLLNKERTIKELKLDMQLQDLAHQHTVENQAMQLAIIQQKNENLTHYLYLFVALFLVVLLLGIYFFRQIQDMRALTQGKEAIIKDKDAEMMNASLHALNGRYFLKGIKKQLEDCEELEGGAYTKKILRKVIRDIDYNDNVGED